MELHRHAESLHGGDGARTEGEQEIAGRLEEQGLREGVEDDVSEERREQDVASEVFEDNALAVPEDDFTSAVHLEEREEDDDEAHVLDRGIGEEALVVCLADHEDGRDGEGEDAEGQHRGVAEAGDSVRHDVAEADDREERAVEERAREECRDGRGGFGVGVGEPGVEGGETRLRAVAGEDEDEADLEPHAAAFDGTLFDELLGVHDEHRAEEGQADADRTDEEVFPHRLQGAATAVVRDERGGDERRQLDRDPHERQARREEREVHRAEERAEAEIVDPMGHVVVAFATVGLVDVEDALNKIRHEEDGSQDNQENLQTVNHKSLNSSFYILHSTFASSGARRRARSACPYRSTRTSG